jgi:mono/diheme cytochrome c family protein
MPNDSKQQPHVDTAIAGIDTSNHQIIIDLPVLAAKGKLPPEDTIHFKSDPHFKNLEKDFIGYALTDLLKIAFDHFHFDTAQAIVLFECTDGYTPTTPLSLLYGKNRPYVVSADAAAATGKKWMSGFEKFAPFYLVWDDYLPADHRYVYPYSLVKIKVLSIKKAFKNAYPSDNPDMVKGFSLYSQNCMKCHAINKVGGVMGPEFNYPKNITEYWSEADIIAFAKNSPSFRINSRMPPVTDLKDEEFAEIVKYLKYISKHKAIE